MQNQVYWQTRTSHSEIPISNNESCDVVIVGGGFAGLSAGESFAKAGKKIVLLEANFCGGGASGRSSGFITPDSELELSTLIENYGAEKARKLWGFVLSGVGHIRTTIETNNILCDFHAQDSLFVANSAKKFQSRVVREHEARMKLGYESTLYSERELPEVLGNLHYHGAVRYPDTFGVNSYLYCQALKEILTGEGVSIYEKSPVTEIGRDYVRANGYIVSAKNVVVCTDRFLPRLGILEPHVYQVQTFLALTKPLSKETIALMFPRDEMMVWDTDLIYQYYRIVENNRLLIGAASPLYAYLPVEIRSPQSVVRIMRRYLESKCPELTFELEYFWPGFLGVSKDFVPLAGQDKNNSNVYYVSAASGLPWAVALGRYVADKVLYGRDDFDQDFNPYRTYPIGTVVQSAIRKPITFALSHAIVKYIS